MSASEPGQADGRLQRIQALSPATSMSAALSHVKSAPSLEATTL